MSNEDDLYYHEDVLRMLSDELREFAEEQDDDKPTLHGKGLGLKVAAIQIDRLIGDHDEDDIVGDSDSEGSVVTGDWGRSLHTGGDDA